MRLSRWLRSGFLAVLGCIAGSGSAINVTITEYPAGHPYDSIALGPDGNMWFTDADAIKVISPAGAIVANLPTFVGCNPGGIALGADGNMFYVCTSLPHLGVVTYSQFADPIYDGGFEYTVPNQPNGFIAIAWSSDPWYSTAAGTIDYYHYINRTKGTVFPQPSALGLACGIDDAVWGVTSGGHLWRDWRTGAADKTIPTIDGDPEYIADCTAQSGHVYFSEYSGDKIGSASYADATGITISELLLAAGSHPRGVACASDGTVWYLASGTNKIGYWKPSTGVHEEFAVPSPFANLKGVAIAPDGSVWFNEANASKIGKLELRPNGDVNGDGKRDVADVFYLINFLFAGGPAPVP